MESDSNNVHERLDREIAAYARERGVLETHHAGKYVVFFEENLRGSFDTFDAAARFAITEYGTGPYLIRQVGASDVMRVPASVAFRPVDANP